MEACACSARTLVSIAGVNNTPAVGGKFLRSARMERNIIITAKEGNVNLSEGSGVRQSSIDFESYLGRGYLPKMHDKLLSV